MPQHEELFDGRSGMHYGTVMKETHIVERFGQAGVPKEKISMVKDTFRFISPDKSPADLIESFRRFYGPTMNA